MDACAGEVGVDLRRGIGTVDRGGGGGGGAMILGWVGSGRVKCLVVVTGKYVRCWVWGSWASVCGEW